MKKETLIDFFKHESSTGVLLVIAMMFAMIMANTSLNGFYDEFLAIPAVISIGTFAIVKPLLLWINDGLMAVFFFMVGLEIKREVTEGSLRHPSAIVVPTFAAFGGMVIPALIYLVFNWNNPDALNGWAIPSTTDIAFALGILSLLGKRVPVGLKLFLLTLAIIDDLGAIIIIALFYTSDLSFLSLSIATVLIVVLITMNRKGIVNNTAYILIGLVLWTAVLKSGVHATLAGVALGLLIPMKNNQESFHQLEDSLYVPVNFVILPLFAFVNTGVGFAHITLSDWTDNITLGIGLGLFLGKQVGVFVFTAIAVWLGFGKLPHGVSWMQLYGVSLLSGIGFTMSLFLGSLAFENARGLGINLSDERLGVLIGSTLSAVIGYLVLKKSLKESSRHD